MAEAGVKDMDLELRAGLLAPAGTPPAIVKKIQDAVIEIVRSDEMREKMKNLEILPVGSTSDAYEARLAKEIGMWAEVVKAGNIKAEQ
jgi:tripartite-type tricarboxylate transporter receptor subunit TctC